jgi:macrolide-specific efflux system membrane fusion protein
MRAAMLGYRRSMIAPRMVSAPAPARRKAWLFASLAAVVVLLAAGGVMLRGRDGDAASLRTAPVERGDIELAVSALGKIGPKSFVDVGAQVSGQLEKVHVQVGERVEQGQLLAEIDPQLLQSRVEGDRARVASLQAQAAERAAGVELAQSQHRRNQALVARGLIARDLAETGAAALKQAQAQQRSLQAQLREAQSTLAGNEASLGYARIHAPIAGTVVSQALLEGQTLNANQVAPTLLRIADLDTMTVTAQVAEADIVRLKPGMQAWFTTLGQPDRRWQGTVRQLLPTPDIVNEVVLYRVLVDVENRDGALLPDMTAQVFFELESARDTLVVPLEAVRRGRRGEGETVQVLVARGRVEPRAVRIGLRDRERAQVLEGLREGERVVLPALREGEAEGRRQGFGLLGGGGRRR